MKIVMEYNVFYISFISTVFIALLLLVRRFWGGRIHRIFFTLAWMIILVRLILPLGVIVPASWSGGVAAAYEFWEQIPFVRFAWIWLAGACITAAVFVVRYVIWGRLLREALPIQNVPGIDEEMFTFMGIRVYVSDRISSPVTFGIFHQKVLLPQYYMKLSREQLKFILIHEKIHIDNHDNLNKFLVIFAVCLHWFNPFAWLMYICCNRDLELACDEKVIRQVGESGREEYANVLISLASKEIIGESVYSGFAGSAIKERIVMIMGYRKVKKWNGVLYAAVCLISMLVFAIPGQTEEKMQDAHLAADQSEDVPAEEYETAEVDQVLKEDVSGARAYVTVRTKEGVELCFKLLMNKKFAVTNSSVLTSYLPEGKKWKAGMDDTYDGTVTIPEAVSYQGEQYVVRRIGSYTFYKCKKVKQIHIPDTVEEIQNRAFYECESLETLRLPASLEVVDINPFIGCRSLKAFEMPEGKAQYLVKDGILYTDFGRFLKVFPQGREQENVTVDENVTQIATCAFYGANVQSVTLPKSVVRVKSKCFQNCGQLARVNAYRETRFASDAFAGAQQAVVERYD